MSSIVFFDPACPKPYDSRSLNQGGIGGTEATMIRVAEGLERKNVETYVLQHNRTEVAERDQDNQVTYAPYEYAKNIVPDVVVVLRLPQALEVARSYYPNSRLYLWIHDLLSPEYADMILAACAKHNAFVLGVSAWHAAHISAALKGRMRPSFIYNPISDTLVSDGTQVDPKKLIYYSSPSKGLAETISLFQAARNTIPDIDLYVANPGYVKSTQPQIPHVTWLGELPHSEVIEHVRSSLCVLLINPHFPETFGLVLAEANAVGTPVITLKHGAAPEILYHPSECVDKPDQAINTIAAWMSGSRPKVKAKPEFRLANVLKRWIALIRG